MHQTTLKNTIQCSGIGLHSGLQVSITLRPATENTGIVFHSITENGIKTIVPAPDAVTATGLATTLGVKGASIATVEHLLATLRGLEIDNVHIDITGKEVPILDGSASQFVEKIQQAGILTQNKPRKVFRIKAPLTVSRGNKWIQAEPFNGFCIDYTIDFPHPTVGIQRKTIIINRHTFEQVAAARTFGFLKDVEALKAHGLALGGSLDNAIVLDDEGVINPDGLRWKDEFVRHKILDFIGDMAVLALPLQGKFTIHCSGHALNNEFLRTTATNWHLYLEEVTYGQERQTEKRLSPRPSMTLTPAVA